MRKSLMGLVAALALVGASESRSPSIAAPPDERPLAGSHVAFLPGVASDTPPPPPSPPPPPGSPSSDELIATALASGAISDETALIYRIFAAFGDARLPAQYRGDDSEHFDATSTVVELTTRFSQLSLPARSAMAPFLKPAFAAGSWYTLPTAAVSAAAADSVNWAMDASSPHIVVWWDDKFPGDALIAKAIITDIDSRIWPKLTSLMGGPMLDLEAEPHGVDGRLDIIVIPETVRSYVEPRLSGCGEEPGTMHIRRNASKQILAHEFMHVLQVRFKFKTCAYPSYVWLFESTAEWAMDFVYPDLNEEHKSAPSMHNDPGFPLEYRNDSHEYGAYLWWLDLTLFRGSPVVRALWDAVAANDDLAAVDLAAKPSGGLEQFWHKFALENMNRAPYDTYETFDKLGSKVALESDVAASPGAGSSTVYTLRANVEHLAALYHHFSFDDKTKSAIVENPLPLIGAAAEKGKVQAFWRLKGSSDWQMVEDLTGTPRKIFCFDKANEDLEELYIVISNAEWKNRSSVLKAGNLKLTASSAPCSGWSGTITSTGTTNAPATNVSISSKATVVFQPDPALVFPGVPPVYFKAFVGNVTWAVQGTIVGCGVSGSGVFPVSWPYNHDTQGWGDLEVRDDGPDLNLRYFIIASASPPVKVTWICPEAGATTIDFSLGAWWSMDPEVDTRLTDEGRMKGEYQLSFTPIGGFSSGQIWTWDLAPE